MLTRRAALAATAALAGCATAQAGFPTQTLAVSGTPFDMPPMMLCAVSMFGMVA